MPKRTIKVHRMRYDDHSPASLRTVDWCVRRALRSAGVEGLTWRELLRAARELASPLTLSDRALGRAWRALERAGLCERITAPYGAEGFNPSRHVRFRRAERAGEGR